MQLFGKPGLNEASSFDVAESKLQGPGERGHPSTPLCACIMQSDGIYARQLRQFCTSGDVEGVRAVLETETNAAASDLVPYLHSAARRGHAHVCQVLIDHGCHVDAVSRSGRTALYLACGNNKLGTVLVLLAAGADVDKQCGRPFDSMVSKANRTPLSMACARGSIGIVEALLEAGATADTDGLYSAASNNDLAIAQLLVNAGCPIDRSSVGGTSPLQKACSHGHLPMVLYLIGQGANIHRANHRGSTALHSACRHGHLPIVQVLVAYGAQRSIKTCYGLSPALSAANRGQHHVVDWLAMSADWTPLQCAAHAGLTNIAISILSSSQGYSPWDLAGPRLSTLAELSTPSPARSHHLWAMRLAERPWCPANHQMHDLHFRERVLLIMLIAVRLESNLTCEVDAAGVPGLPQELWFEIMSFLDRHIPTPLTGNHTTDNVYFLQKDDSGCLLQPSQRDD